jgi:hypothetical protein
VSITVHYIAFGSIFGLRRNFTQFVYSHFFYLLSLSLSLSLSERTILFTQSRTRAAKSRLSEVSENHMAFGEIRETCEIRESHASARTFPKTVVLYFLDVNNNKKFNPILCVCSNLKFNSDLKRQTKHEIWDMTICLLIYQVLSDN